MRESCGFFNRPARTIKRPRVVDLGLCNGADDGNRTRALSLGITGACRASVLVSGT
ncbi:hypothetical protein SCOCK_60189 [Actinacidiphila cocklensis]|uniref:Uncharacterized protein n=1 Tax=Actinacidiphila cocklensis TaxID=887465 RepID=A0A9W4GUT3_9ACTN|nr:hypothetical protein SCOCK_60189 [Actinacidiphila cocklensis]